MLHELHCLFTIVQSAYSLHVSWPLSSSERLVSLLPGPQPETSEPHSDIPENAYS